MSEDPERLSSRTSGASALERELLSSLRAEGPPEGAREVAWDAVARRIAIAGVVGATASLSSSTTAAAAGTASDAVVASGLKTAVLAPNTLLVKLGIALGLGAAGIGGAVLATRPPSERVAPAPVVALRAAPAAALPPHDDPPAAEPSCEGAACSSAPAAQSTLRRVPLETERTTQLGRESALLVRARSELRAGDTAAASASLAELEKQFPRGALTQEREVLGIEVLAARGDLTRAGQRARAFIRSHPTSPHSAKLQRFLSQP
jgi:hypothetical protein